MLRVASASPAPRWFYGVKGLDADEVGELLDVIAEQDVPRALADAISAETSGKPFFFRGAPGARTANIA